MTMDEVRKRLSAARCRTVKEERLGNDTGTKLRIGGGAIVNVFDNGTVNCQGKNRKAVEEYLGIGVPVAQGAAAQVNTKIFVAYGHDATAGDQLEAMLRRWGLELIILDQLPSEGQTIIEKLEGFADQVGFASCTSVSCN